MSPDDEQRIARTKSQELFLLEQIQAEAAAFYSYEALPPVLDPPKERKIVRTNLSSKYDRLSLDEIAGKQHPPPERRNSLDFKILSLEEIRARKKAETVHSPPITLNLSRKRKPSTQETITTAGNKIIKVVRSNSVVYKKVDRTTLAVSSQAKIDLKQSDSMDSRKRTLSEQSDVYEMQEDELVDNCYEFKRIKIAEHTSKPRLIRNRHISVEKIVDNKNANNNKDNDSDEEVQIISVVIPDKDSKIDSLSDTEVIDVESTKICEPIDIVDLSEDSDVAESDHDLNLGKNVPDVVASCHMNKVDNAEKDLLKDIDCLLNENKDSDDNILDNEL